MQDKSVKNIRITRVGVHGAIDADDQLAIEEPLEIQLKYGAQADKLRKTISVTMRTPGNDRELAIGFLFTEGIIQDKSQVTDIGHDPFDENKIIVTCSENFTPSLQTSERNFYTTSSCGVCGKSSIDAIKTVSQYQEQKDSISVAAESLYFLKEKLKEHQQIFQHTGGLHASALFNLNGQFILAREDVGRHNALDKVIGAAFLNEQLPLKNAILLLSGRASFELLQKASMAGIKVVAAIGAPSSLAVQLAEESNTTLIGFLGNEKFNIYTGNQRVAVPVSNLPVL